MSWRINVILHLRLNMLPPRQRFALHLARICVTTIRPNDLLITSVVVALLLISQALSTAQKTTAQNDAASEQESPTDEHLPTLALPAVLISVTTKEARRIGHQSRHRAVAPTLQRVVGHCQRWLDAHTRSGSREVLHPS